MEARGFRDAIEQFSAAGVQVVGISTDSVVRQSNFALRSELLFPLLTDSGGAVCRAYGARGLLGFARRVSFLVGGDGVIRKTYSRVSPGTHAAEVLKDLRGLA